MTLQKIGNRRVTCQSSPRATWSANSIASALGIKPSWRTEPTRRSRAACRSSEAMPKVYSAHINGRIAAARSTPVHLSASRRTQDRAVSNVTPNEQARCTRRHPLHAGPRTGVVVWVRPELPSFHALTV